MEHLRFIEGFDFFGGPFFLKLVSLCLSGSSPTPMCLHPYRSANRFSDCVEAEVANIEKHVF